MAVLYVHMSVNIEASGRLNVFLCHWQPLSLKTGSLIEPDSQQALAAILFLPVPPLPTAVESQEPTVVPGNVLSM